MKKRQIIIVLVGIAIVVVARMISSFLATPKEKQAPKARNNVTTVFTADVKNDSIPIYVSSTGVLKAVRRLELYSEVQGVMEDDQGRFKAGNTFQQGETLISIRSQDQRAQLYAQRSAFQSALTAIMPDLKIDYPNEFATWDAYLKAYHTEQAVKALPEVNNDKLKTFLIGRNIYNNYHTVRNLEIINEKYRIKAPYNGVLIASEVDPGTVIRNGQLLGVFIQADRYEMETSIDATTANYLSVGQEVKLIQEGTSNTYAGKISRLVKAIDENSQLSTFFVEVQDANLKEGMFLKAEVKAQRIPNAFELNRSALVDNKEVYVVQADTLAIKAIEVKHLSQNTAIISGLKDEEKVLTKVPPSAFPGMKVAIYKAQ